MIVAREPIRALKEVARRGGTRFCFADYGFGEVPRDGLRPDEHAAVARLHAPRQLRQHPPDVARGGLEQILFQTAESQASVRLNVAYGEDKTQTGQRADTTAPRGLPL